jgi:hypothetical protein
VGPLVVHHRPPAPRGVGGGLLAGRDHVVGDHLPAQALAHQFGDPRRGERLGAGRLERAAVQAVLGEQHRGGLRDVLHVDQRLRRPQP